MKVEKGEIARINVWNLIRTRLLNHRNIELGVSVLALPHKCMFPNVTISLTSTWQNYGNSRGMFQKKIF